MRAFVTTLPLSGLASSSGTERVATRMVQADLLLCRFLDEALIPCVIDEGARLTGCRPASTLDGHLAGTVRAGLPARCMMAPAPGGGGVRSVAHGRSWLICSRTSRRVSRRTVAGCSDRSCRHGLSVRS